MANPIDRKYTDIELVLVDPNNSITIPAHKLVLVRSSNYFAKLLNFAREKYESRVTIHVSNSKIAYDIILSFYDTKVNSHDRNNWKYLLETFKCRDYFCLNNDVHLLYDLEVRPKEFALLLEIADHFDFVKDRELVETIKKNIPIDYDLDNFTIEFIEILLELKNYLIVSGGRDCCIKIWNYHTGKLLRTLNGHTDWIRCVTISFDNSRIISGSDDCNIKIWDTKTGTLLNTLVGHAGPVNSVAISRDNSRIISGSRDANIKIWDACTGKILATLAGHWGSVSCVALSRDNLLIVSGSEDTNIKIWDVPTGKLLATLTDHTWTILFVQFSDSNLQIVSGSRDGLIKIWDTETCQLLTTLFCNSVPVRSIWLQSNSMEIVSGDLTGSMQIWNMELDDLLKTSNKGIYSNFRMVMTPNNRNITFSSNNGTKIGDIATEKLSMILCAHADLILCMTIGSMNNDINNKLMGYYNRKLSVHNSNKIKIS